MVYTYYMVCVTCVLIEQLVPARPPKKLKGDGLPLVVLRGCLAGSLEYSTTLILLYKKFVLKTVNTNLFSVYMREKCAKTKVSQRLSP